jgi:hypothetical protein
MLVLPAWAFRVKRRILLTPTDGSGPNVYQFEDSVFDEIGVAKPREPDIGLWARVAFYSLLVWAAFVLASFAVLLVTGHAESSRPFAAASFFAVAALILVSIAADLVGRRRGHQGRLATVRQRIVILATAVALLFALVPSRPLGVGQRRYRLRSESRRSTRTSRIAASSSRSGATRRQDSLGHY